MKSHTELAIEQVIAPVEHLVEDVQAGRMSREFALDRFKEFKPTEKWADVMAADFEAVTKAYELAGADLKKQCPKNSWCYLGEGHSAPRCYGRIT